MSARCHFLLRAFGPLIVMTGFLGLVCIVNSSVIGGIFCLIAPPLTYYLIDYLLTHGHKDYPIFRGRETNVSTFLPLVILNFIAICSVGWGLPVIVPEIHNMTGGIQILVLVAAFFTLHALFLSCVLVSNNTYGVFLYVVYPSIQQAESNRRQRQIEWEQHRQALREQERLQREREQEQRRQGQMEAERQRQQEAELRRAENERKHDQREIAAAKAQLESFYREHKSALQHAIPQAVFTALLKSEFPKDVSPDDAWKITHRLLGEFYVMAHGQRETRAINPDDV